MGITVIELNNFYHTPLGIIINDEILKVIDYFSENSEIESIVFIGFTPDEKKIKNLKNKQTLYISPAQQGVLFLANLHTHHHQILSYENALPIPDASVDHVILIHAIENSHNPSVLLEEIFRILKGKGKLLVITPNRRGLWAQSTNTPFGYGHPYTMTQLTTLLNENNFTPVRSKRCLYLPPSQNRLILKLTPFFHHIGRILFRKFSGLICIESVKSVYHPISLGARRKGIAILSKTQGKMIEAIERP